MEALFAHLPFLETVYLLIVKHNHHRKLHHLVKHYNNSKAFELLQVHHFAFFILLALISLALITFWVSCNFSFSFLIFCNRISADSSLGSWGTRFPSKASLRIR